MTAQLVGRFDVGTPAWHAARANGLGGSEIAAVLGLSPWESRFSLWHRKAGVVGPVEESPEMEWGKRLEPVILAKFCDLHPELGVQPAGTWRHSDRPWQIANPDLLTDEEVVESKTARIDIGWGEPGTDEIPIYYRAQAMWYLDVLERDRCLVPVLLGGSDYREYEVVYDLAEARQLRAAAEEFLHTIEVGERPDIDAHGATYQVIRDLHPDIDGTDIDLPADLAARFCAARAALAQATDAEQLAKSEIADLMGTARRAVFDGHTVATRQARGDGTPYLVAGRGLDAITFERTAAA